MLSSLRSEFTGCDCDCAVLLCGFKKLVNSDGLHRDEENSKDGRACSVPALSARRPAVRHFDQRFCQR